MADVLTRDGFTEWVQGKREDDVVGMAGRADSCPLATYLKERGHCEPRVRDEYYCLDGLHEFGVYNRSEHYPLEAWMRRLIRAVDDLGLGLPEDVRAGEVLAVLDGLDD